MPTKFSPNFFFSLSKLPTNKPSFTLVEVLIVLVIISIMAGILITVINPVRLRARARDGNIIATATKIVTAIKAFNSATGIYPPCASLATTTGGGPELQNVTSVYQCTGREGSFLITGITTPTGAGEGCGTAYYQPGSSRCRFRYEALSNGSRACLGIRLHNPADVNNDGVLNEYLIWDSTTTGGSLSDQATPTCNI